MIASKYRPFMVYSACSLIALAIFTSNLKGGALAQHLESAVLFFMNPIYSTVDGLIHKVKNTWSSYIFFSNVSQENKYLNKELSASRYELATLREQVQLLERHKHMWESAGELHRNIVVAEIVRRGSESWETVLLVNAGRLDGIQPDCGVASPAGVVGKVVRVSPKISKLLSILHPQSGISCITRKSRIQGILSGTGEGTCSFKYANRFEKVILGEPVITSGLEGCFPKGLLIGHVIRSERRSGNIFQEIDVLPAVDLSGVETVMLFLPEYVEVPE